MAVADFPEIGSQIRRKSDGTLGDVYASDPPRDILTVRWPTIPGAYATRDCSFDQFAHELETTGVHLARYQPGMVAPVIIGLVVLMFLVFVLARNILPAYTAYDAAEVQAADSLATLEDPQSLEQEYGTQATAQCAAGASAYLGSIAGANYQWTPATSTFERYRTSITAPGVLTMVSSQAQIALADGVSRPIDLLCNYDTQRHTVLSYSYTAPPGPE